MIVRMKSHAIWRHDMHSIHFQRNEYAGNKLRKQKMQPNDMWLAPTLFRLVATCDVKIWLQIAVRIRCAWMNRTEHNVWPTSTRFKANAPHSSAMNKAEALAERESRQAMNWNSIEGTRQTAYRHDGIAAPKKVPNDEANDFEPFQFWRIAYSLGHLCGSVFSRSLISSTSNSETHSLARNRPNQRPNGPFRSAVSCQRKTNDVFCVSFHFRVRTRDIVARTRLRNAIIPLRCVRPMMMIYRKHKCESRNNSSK